MTTTIPHRELRNRSSEILQRVRAGENFEITNHGEVVAVLVPPPALALETLRVRRATTSGSFASFRRHRLATSTAEVLDDLRGDR